LGESTTYDMAVKQNSMLNNVAIQAEPSTYHLVTSKNDRKVEKITKAETEEEIEKIKNKSWVVMDNEDVKNFNQMVPEPAISYPFELDEF
jgi:antiviral helicase SKI2